mmetsp:Transcript_13067/g.28331  ORF Transcript_13067/g.28331 Transcript_13067/m.28331 type:complete len:223 (-) Transcript_13067:175-843(-)|eukprot:CAMPEP_0178501912 /NCGR_PEP_ID=MMETSP0696-20121128/17218_1 /TAXON_ID=265572 /ORGANISM="Extubocellulus spinifer, Strain CCMP396" /LENGTH=222 /DNA_ID=CAMNT_0020130923 /DNA_START=170 /DNA_END=838 /DNA_ORIENTATION=+
MCCATVQRSSSRSARTTHRSSLSVDSFFFASLGSNQSKENLSPLEDNPSFSAKRLSATCNSTPLLAARPGPLRHRAQTENVGVRRSKSFKVTTKNNVSSRGKPPLVPKSARKLKKSVKFSTVDTRGYNLIVCDHPSVTSGLGISLGWDHRPISSVAIDEYEASKIKKGTGKSSDELLLPRRKRNSMLVKCGNYTERDVFVAERKKEMADRESFFKGHWSNDM